MNTKEFLATLRQTFEELQAQLPPQPNERTTESRFLKFTDKEISKMPKTFRKEFRIEGCTAHVRKRCDDRYNCSYEIRYRRNGYNVTASATTLDVAKERFIEKLHQADKQDTAAPAGRVPTTFNEFAYFWFENFYKRKVAENTYKAITRLFRGALSHRFENVAIKKINAHDLQTILDEYSAQGKGKTTDELYSLLNQIFGAGVKFGLIMHNPIDMVFHKRHERKHGVALTLDEEKLLLSSTADTPYQRMFAVALYTGLRPNEFVTAEIKGDMIIAVNSKRKNGKREYKRIPINPMLKPHLANVDRLQWACLSKIREQFRLILPNHKLYDLRTSFYTHCVTCGVAQSAINEMVGHSSGELKDTYTDLPDEFLYHEAQKLVW